MKLQARISQQSDSYVARRVAMDVLGMTKEEIVTSYQLPVAMDVLGQMDVMMAAYDGGKPLAYVLGYELFAEHRFLVDERVLIPRAETEELVALAAEGLLQVVASRRKSSNNGGGVLLLDMGTGSGCVGISIMKRVKKDEGSGRRVKKGEEGGRRVKEVQCVLCDVNEGALEVAEENINRLCHSGLDQESLQLEKDPASSAGGQRIVTRQVDVMKLTDDDQGLDEFLEEVDEVVVVANLPYIPEGYEGVEDDVQAREPHLALYSGDDGLVHYRALLEWVRQKVKEGGRRMKKDEEGTRWTVWMEMMTEQGQVMVEEHKGSGKMQVHETFHSNVVVVEMSLKQ